jgi:hypothetical protein
MAWPPFVSIEEFIQNLDPEVAATTQHVILRSNQTGELTTLERAQVEGYLNPTPPWSGGGWEEGSWGGGGPWASEDWGVDYPWNPPEYEPIDPPDVPIDPVYPGPDPVSPSPWPGPGEGGGEDQAPPLPLAPVTSPRTPIPGGVGIGGSSVWTGTGSITTTVGVTGTYRPRIVLDGSGTVAVTLSIATLSNGLPITGFATVGSATAAAGATGVAQLTVPAVSFGSIRVLKFTRTDGGGLVIPYGILLD